MSISSLTSSNPYEQLISQMISIERQPQLALKKQKSDLNVRKGVLTDFNSALSALRTSLRSLTDLVTNPFAARKASVTEGAGFTASATDRAAPGAHSLQVERLATADTRVSQRLDAAGSALVDFFAGKGAQTFGIEVFAPTSAEPQRRVAVEVTVAPTGGTDADVLAEVRAAIRTAMDGAVSAGTIERRYAPTASVVRETADTARLTLRSGETGYAGRLAFTDSADGLLGFLGLDADALSEGAAGGQITAVGASDAESALNARFVLDGLTLVRPSNEVRDALDGVTLTLTAAGEPATLRIGTDGEATTKAVEEFIEKYNAIQSFLKKRTHVDGETGVRGEFAGDASFRGLRFGLRDDIQRTVAGQPDGIGALRELGIEVDKDGLLKLADKEKLTAAAERDPLAVQRLFSAEEGGVGTRLLERIQGFIGKEGVLTARRNAADARIKTLDSRIKRWDEQLASRESILRKQFAQLQEVTMSLQGQFGAVSAFLYGSGYGY